MESNVSRPADASQSTPVTSLSAPSQNDLQRIEEGLFFIVGDPRSGTTLLRAILSSHPQIVIPPETKFFAWFEPPDALDGWSTYLDRWFTSTSWLNQSLDTEAFRRSIEATDRTTRSVFLTMLAMHAARAGKPRVGEKTPNHILHAERIHRLFPSAKFIHARRDPRDVVASQLRMPWKKRSHLKCARQWRNTICKAQRLEAFLPTNLYTNVRYEALVTQPEVELRRICEFLGETYHEEMLRIDQHVNRSFTDREQQTAAQTLRPISTASIGNYTKHLSPRQIAGIERMVKSQFLRCGYVRSPTVYRLHWYFLDAVDIMLELASRGWRLTHPPSIRRDH